MLWTHVPWSIQQWKAKGTPWSALLMFTALNAPCAVFFWTSFVRVANGVKPSALSNRVQLDAGMLRFLLALAHLPALRGHHLLACPKRFAALNWRNLYPQLEHARRRFLAHLLSAYHNEPTRHYSNALGQNHLEYVCLQAPDF